MKIYREILQGYKNTEKQVKDWVSGVDFSEIETEINSVPSHHKNYIDTVKGIDIYYNIAADYYFFSDSE